jgi:putative membrane protein
MNAKTVAAAMLALGVTGLTGGLAGPLLAQDNSGPAKGVPQSSTVQGGPVTTQGGTPDQWRAGTGTAPAQMGPARTGDAQNGSGGPAMPVLSLSSHDFVQMAAQGGQFEVEAGRLAVDKSARDSVKDFARLMVQDHSKANQQLASLARQHRIVDLPEQPDARHQQQLQQLSQLPATQFDGPYLQGQLQAHQDTIRLFETASRATGQDMQDFKDYASQTLPTLRDHLQRVQALVGQGVPTARQ